VRGGKPKGKKHAEKGVGCAERYKQWTQIKRNSRYAVTEARYVKREHLEWSYLKSQNSNPANWPCMGNQRSWALITKDAN